MDIHHTPLPYEERLPERPASAIDLIVMHCTELPDLAMARQYGEVVHYPATQTGNSGHYYVDRDGAVYRYVNDTRVANHTRGYNPRSIGIEMINLGRYPSWKDSRHQAFTEPYTEAQIGALLALLRELKADHPNLRYIAAHADLDCRLEPASDDVSVMLPRRVDPGPLFPWTEVVAGSGLVRLIPLPDDNQ
ncbi:MAG: N-acetylmuramoyl-L-alanine amidase [Dokdonella sp.]